MQHLISFLHLHPIPAITAVATLSLVASLIRFASSDADASTRSAASRLPATGAFAGEVVFLTGASSGIGAALALRLAAGGATLLLAARREDRLRDVAARCLAAGAAAAIPVPFDALAFDAAGPLIAKLVATHGPITILINNAGRSQRGLCERTPTPVERELFELNYFSATSLTRVVLPCMLAAGKGKVVNICSVAGKSGSPLSGTYASTKAALFAFGDSLRMEVAGRGVSVLNVCPGPVESEVSLHATTDVPGVKHALPQDAATKRVPAERCAQLFAGGIWAGLHEVWIAPQPILAFTYLSQFARGWGFEPLSVKVGTARVKAFAAGDAGYSSVSNLSNLWGGGKKNE